jgi:hypothetical protein
MNSEHILAPQAQAERVIALFDGNSPESRALGQRVSAIIENFVNSGRVTSSGSSAAIKDALRDTSIPEFPRPSTAYLDYLERDIVSHSVNVACPRFIGHMTSALPCFLQHVGRLMLALN